MFTRAFWRAAGERAVKTFAQVFVTSGLVNVTGILDVDWTSALSTSGLAALVSVLTSVASGAVTNGSPSLTNAEVVVLADDHKG